jgi:hypothetical protein
MNVTDLEHILTEKDFEIAEANGIPRKLVRERFNRLFWDKKDCITKPVRGYRDDEWRMRCKELGIVDISTFDQRKLRGWDGKEAATKPKMSYEEVVQRIKKVHCKYPGWVYESIEKHGIPKQTFLNRMNMKNTKWTLEEACTVPKGVRLSDWRLRDYQSKRELESKSG